MATLKEVFEVYRTVKTLEAFLGATAEFQRKFLERFARIGKTMMEELGISRQECMALPPETALGIKAEAAFQKLKYWLIKQGLTFKE